MEPLLKGCWAKIERADESITQLDKDLIAYLDREPKNYDVVGKFQNDFREYAFVVSGDPSIPMRFSVVAGEIVHHLRSCLDHLICALVMKNGNQPSRQHQFPICATAVSFERACKNGMIKGVGSSATKLIRSVQPYKGKKPQDTILQAIHQFDIWDKHRLLLVVNTAVHIGNEITVGVDEGILSSFDEPREPPAITGLGDPRPRIISREGVVVFKIFLEKSTPEFKADAQIVRQIAFEKCGEAELVPVVPTLRLMLEGTKHTLNKFEAEF